MATAKTTTKASKKEVAEQADFAVIKAGGKQYKFAVGETITIEKIFNPEGLDYKKGDEIVFPDVLLFDDGKDTLIGTPHISGMQVKGTVAVVGRNPKLIVIKYLQKSRYFKKNGHKQPHLKVVINSIK